MGSNLRGSRSQLSVYTVSFLQDRECDLGRDPVFLLRVNGVCYTKESIVLSGGFGLFDSGGEE